MATNLGSAPIGTNRGFVGVGSTLTLRAGDRLETGDWELRIATPRTRRRIVGSVATGGGRTLTLVAGMSRREYANGVLLAELGPARADHRVELAAAVLRFTAAGKRHADADVCDSTHCAWFVGRGPYLSWSEPLSPVEDAGGAGARILTDAEWSAAQAQAHTSGPAHWTSDCGSQPLSAHAVWGGTDDGEPVVAHAQHPAREWQRRWSDRDVERAFGAGVAGLAVAWRQRHMVPRRAQAGSRGSVPQRTTRLTNASRACATGAPCLVPPIASHALPAVTSSPAVASATASAFACARQHQPPARAASARRTPPRRRHWPLWSRRETSRA